MEKRFAEIIVRSIPLFAAIIVVFTTILGITNDVVDSTFLTKNRYLIVVIATTVLITSVFLQTLNTINKNPVSITLSLLGFPRVGKTVFLTMLFEELQKSQDSYVNFSPYGSETIERVLSDVNTLRNGVWLPPTSINQVFYYRAFATLNSVSKILKVKRKYKIEIADYAGEHIDQFNSQKENWLHKTEYFKYALQSDAIFLALDVAKYLDERELYQRDIDGLIAAVQILAEHKGAIHGDKASVPISIIFLKSDLIDFDRNKEKRILFETDRLISICKNRFEDVKWFFVSSTGHLENGEIVGKVKPVNVVDPLLWLLKRSRIR